MKKSNTSPFLPAFLTGCLLLILSFNASAVEIDQAIRAEMDRFNDEYEKPELDTSAKTILELFKLDFPGLEDVNSAYQAGDYDQAMEALLDYFRNRKSYIELTVKTTQIPYSIKLADDTLNHIIKGNKNYDPVFRGTKIDWVGKAVIDGKVIHDVEWLYHYHRLYWWTYLARAYQETQDDDYFYEWRYQLVNYTDEILPISSNSIVGVSRGMETYDRCEVAMRILPAFIKSDLFDAKLLRIYLAFFHHQAEHIRKVYAGGGNHLLGEVTRVFINGLYFPELKKSDEWIEEGMSMIPSMMKQMVYDEGMNKELVFSYNVMYCELFYEFYQQARANGFADRLPEGFADTLKGLHDIQMIALLPDGSTPQFGDAWKFKKLEDGTFVPRYAAWIFDTWIQRYPDEPHYRYLASDGQEGTAWEETCFRFDQSGFHFFRNEWGRDAIYLAMKYGPVARGHNQPDNGTFSLSAYGRDFMIDSGSYVYNSSDPEEKEWRKWFRQSAVHQTLTLNNENLHQDPAYLLWENSDDLTVAVVDNLSYEGLTHRRIMMFVDKQFFVIFDEATGEATGDVRLHFQLNSCDPVFADNGKTVYTNDEDMPNLLLKAFPQNPDTVMEEEEGWVSYLYKHKQPRPAFSYKVHKPDDEPVQYLTALVPSRDELPESLLFGLDVRMEKESENRYTFLIRRGTEVRLIEVDVENQTASMRTDS